MGVAQIKVNPFSTQCHYIMNKLHMNNDWYGDLGLGGVVRKKGELV